ncbi:MAG: hypothetical protein JXM68_12680, partial [Sedimentisphaerales bacterium]|nr:hypothetical protein [Sedimentisphaerales bacterium]
LLFHLPHTQLKSFSQLTGSMPIGQMFDITLGVLASYNGIAPQKFRSIKVNPAGDLAIAHYYQC